MSRARLSGAVDDICLDLVAVPSEYGDEGPLAHLVEERLRAIGLEHERIGNSIVARAGGSGVPLALVGHLDTVPNWPGGTAERDGDRIVGRGAADMKGGVAVMLALLQRMTGDARAAVAVFYDREEGPNQANGIHRVLAESALLDPRPSLAVVLEPTGCTIHAGAVGSLNAAVSYAGRAAHAARPWEGENAISRDLAAAIERFADRAPRDVEVDGLVYRDVVTVTTIHGGTAHNVVPDRVELHVNVRVAPGGSIDAAQAEVEALAGPAAHVEWLDSALPAAPNLADPAVADFVSRSGLQVLPKQAWTDVATLVEWGVPALNFGPGDPSQAHQTGEWVSVANLRTCEAVLAAELGLR